MEKLLTIDQVSELLQIKPKTIYNWVHEDFIPHIKLFNNNKNGGRVRFRESELLSWLRRREKKGRKSTKLHI